MHSVSVRFYVFVCAALTILRQFVKKVKAPQWRDMGKALMQTLESQAEKACLTLCLASLPVQCSSLLVMSLVSQVKQRRLALDAAPKDVAKVAGFMAAEREKAFREWKQRHLYVLCGRPCRVLWITEPCAALLLMLFNPRRKPLPQLLNWNHL